MSNSCQTAYLSVYVSMTNLVAPIGLCAIAPEKKIHFYDFKSENK